MNKVDKKNNDDESGCTPYYSRGQVESFGTTKLIASMFNVQRQRLEIGYFARRWLQFGNVTHNSCDLKGPSHHWSGEAAPLPSSYHDEVLRPSCSNFPAEGQLVKLGVIFSSMCN